MKRFLLITLVAVMCAGVAVLYLKLETLPDNDAAKTNQLGEHSIGGYPPPRPKRALLSNTPSEIQDIMPRVNAVFHTNVSEWIKAVPELIQIETNERRDIWAMDGLAQQIVVPILLENGSNSIIFSTSLIEIQAEKITGEIRNLVLHSVGMSIEQLRPFGVELHQMINLDPEKFVKWCDQVGNVWLDAPLYSAGKGDLPNSAKIPVFSVLRTYDDEKPWFIKFSVQE